MESTERINEVLNDLIQINNDRVEGYEKAVKETSAEDGDLRSIFSDMANESRNYAKELATLLAPTKSPDEEGTTIKGKIYRVWMDLKTTFSGNSRKSVLAACEYGEDAAQKAYESALASDAEISADVRQLIMKQKASLRKSHDRIKMMRDAQPA